MTTKVAIIGPGHVGTDLLVKLHRHPGLEPVAVAGTDPDSPGLAMARELGVATTDRGVAGLVELDAFADVAVVLDASTAAAHTEHVAVLAPHERRLVALTPAATTSMVVPSVNLDQLTDGPAVGLVSCSGQAAVPIVHAISGVVAVHYAEVVASIASSSAGQGTRANLDEFTEATRQAIQRIGGARRGKAVTVLNPADPPMAMRVTVLGLVDALDDTRCAAISSSVEAAVTDVAGRVPGYRLKQDVGFRPIERDEPLRTLIGEASREHWEVAVSLEVRGAGDHLGTYAGNLDIMTTAALDVTARLGARDVESEVA
ncbi:acetaldehyde dehydrogenase (acetylating) [Prauserella cavernicola]|uniref:Acetaldehyde dehydrogenase n=1 Tax=Prauserella cavernicola TaxID=2800127 RepID=A0A934V400_9PSEU|nr:acetaldehyde dehydrogenase (acetylating) [Prauserella cavernicola]MBK1787841.1 acetaldehyde dehydrogenase (acetylating) [Prauserella cavernicola]